MCFFYTTWGLTQNYGGPYKKDYSIWGSILGSWFWGNDQIGWEMCYSFVGIIPDWMPLLNLKVLHLRRLAVPHVPVHASGSLEWAHSVSRETFPGLLQGPFPEPIFPHVMQLQNWSQLSSVFVVGVWHTLQLQGSKITVRDIPQKISLVLILSLPYCLQ